MPSSPHTFVCRRLTAVLIAALSLAAMLVGTAAASPLTWSAANGVPVTPPANAASPSKAIFDWGACSTPGSCSAVGTYTDENGDEQALAATRINGTWGQAVEITLPANAATNPKPIFEISGAVVCPATGSCVAVGDYTDSEGHQEGMIAEETNGTWGRAVEITLPANATTNPEVYLYSVTCSGAGSCTALGEYKDTASVIGNTDAPVVLAESGGTWHTSALTLPANAAATPDASLSTIACSAAGFCVAIGSYVDGEGNQEGMVVRAASGTWGQAEEIKPPQNADSEPAVGFGSIACSASGSCVASDVYTDSAGDREGMVAEETNGTWGQAVEIAPPANAAASARATFELACPASGGSGSCVAVGHYMDSSGAWQGMTAVQTDGTWGQASELALPANATAWIGGLGPACTSTSCVAVGEYTETSGERQGFAAEETGGTWGQASEITAPANADPNPVMDFGPLQCFTATSCVAFGGYTNSSGKTENFEVTGTAPAPASPTVSFTPTFLTNALGHGTIFTAALTISGSETPNGPSPLKEVTVHLPAGVAGTSAGFATCERSALEANGPAGCPATSIAGPPGSVTFDVTLGGSTFEEHGTIQAIYASATELYVYLQAVSPIFVETVTSGGFSANVLTLALPEIEIVPGAPNGSITAMTLEFGASHQEGDKEVYNVTVPDQCPSGGFSWSATLGFADGATSGPTATSPCPEEEAVKKREEEQAATKKHEEETAAQKKKEEEAATKGSGGGSNTPSTGSTTSTTTTTPATAAATGSVSLDGSTITVTSSGRATIKLTCTGTATCGGKLTLTAKTKSKGKKKAKAATIGTATFSIPAGKTTTVTVTLTGTGRGLLSAAHGKLPATLTILKSSPSPAQTKADNVRLAEQKATKAKKGKK